MNVYVHNSNNDNNNNNNAHRTPLYSVRVHRLRGCDRKSPTRTGRTILTPEAFDGIIRISEPRTYVGFCFHPKGTIFYITIIFPVRPCTLHPLWRARRTSAIVATFRTHTRIIIMKRQYRFFSPKSSRSSLFSPSIIARRLGETHPIRASHVYRRFRPHRRLWPECDRTSRLLAPLPVVPSLYSGRRVAPRFFDLKRF